MQDYDGKQNGSEHWIPCSNLIAKELHASYSNELPDTLQVPANLDLKIPWEYMTHKD